jgi:hypothetical protein
MLLGTKVHGANRPLCRGYFVSSSLPMYPAGKIYIERLCGSMSTSIDLLRLNVLDTNCSPLSWILLSSSLFVYLVCKISIECLCWSLSVNIYCLGTPNCLSY